MRPRWTRRLVFAAIASVAVYASLAIAGTRPQPLLLATVFAVLATVGWLSLDLSRQTEPAFWKVTTRDTDAGRGAEPRVGVLRRRITEASTVTHQSAQLHAVLLGVVEDRLSSGYGIDLRTEPDRAARVLGPVLSDYILRPTSAQSPRKLPAIEELLTRIEAL